jgi:hypothetical protein
MLPPKKFQNSLNRFLDLFLLFRIATTISGEMKSINELLLDIMELKIIVLKIIID